MMGVQVANEVVVGAIAAVCSGGVVAFFRFKGGNNKLLATQQSELYERQERRIAALELAEAACQKETAILQATVAALRAEITLVKGLLERYEPFVIANIVCDSFGKITEWNDGAAQMFGWSRQEAVGQNVGIIVPNHLREQHDRSFAKAVAEQRGPSQSSAALLRESFGVRREGIEFPISITLRSWELRGERLYSAEVRRR